MNQRLQIALTIIGIAIALYGAFIFGRTSSVPVSENTMATTTTSTSTEVTASTTKPVIVKPTSIKPNSGNTLVQISYRGGSCPNGKLCSTIKTITKDAVYFKDGVRISNLNKNDVAKISQTMNTMDFATLRSKIKNGCDLVRTQEITYMFYTNKGLQSISNCQYDFDITAEPFRTIGITLPQ